MVDEKMEICNQLNMETEQAAFKWSQMGHGNSIDAGYESLLSTSSLSYSSSLTSNSSSVTSQPSTPLKSTSGGGGGGGFIMSSNNSTTTPDLRQKYIADVNSMYLASIRADSGFASPIKSGSYSSSSFGNYSASSSNSPVVLGIKSPKFEFESYIQQRDNFNSKLLKSPAFKLNPTTMSARGGSNHTPAVVIKSFSSRLQLNLLSPPAGGEKDKDTDRRVVTPTEEEFLQMLIRNKHIPANPDSLIGRHMGVEKLNIVGELWKRSMNNVLDAIFGYLDVRDLVRVGCVSNEWRAVLKENKKLYKLRTEFIRQRRIQSETFKENRAFPAAVPCVSHNDFDMEMSDEMTPVCAWPYAKLSLEEKRNILNRHRAQVSLELNKQCHDRAANNNQSAQNLHRTANGNFVFASLDLNCLNNYASQSSQLTDQFVQATESLSLTRTVNQLKKAPSTTTFYDHEPSSTLAKFICKNLKVSPSKHTSPTKRDPLLSCVSPVSTAPSKIDLIGSKKSRKNLKRL